MTYPGDVPPLTDGTVVLRAHRRDDVQAIVEQCQDPHSQRFTPVPVPYGVEDAEAFVAGRREKWDTGLVFSFAIESEHGAGPSRFAGSVDLTLRAPGIGEVGYGLHPRARGHGVAGAAVGLIVDWAFGEHQLDTLVWHCLAGNLQSWRVAWRNGFTFEGTTRKTMPMRGEALDGWSATLLATDSREPKTTWLREPRLSDGRVALRPVRLDDEGRYLETVLDAETDLWLHDIPLVRRAEVFREHVRDAGLAPSLGSAVFLAVADAATDRYVGGFALFGFGGLDHGSAEVGYRTHPDSRGRGYASGALRLAIGHAFTRVADGGYGLERLSLNAGEGNAASVAVARACGFTQTGRDRRCYRLADGRLVDTLRFDLLADERRPRRHAQ